MYPIDSKKKTLDILTAKSGKKYDARKFKNEAVEYVIMINIIFEENVLFESKAYNEIRKAFLECSIQEIIHINVYKSRAEFYESKKVKDENCH